jgi:hypothetical protein
MIAVLVIGACAGLAWLVAVVSWLLAVSHRKPEVSLARLVFSGMAAFDPNNFTDVGRRHQKRFLIAFLIFFLSCIAGVVAGALSAP